jgi:glycerol-3-phosphate dehydrogenase
MNFSTVERNSRWDVLAKNQWDVMIIGGGITGAGIALEAASRGMKVALLEMQDFAAGTSSRSTKLIHGGLRYLKQFQVKLVSEVGKERAIVYENGPHVTTPERMVLPIYKGAKYGKLATAFAVSFYDCLAGVKKAEKKEILSKAETLKLIPILKKEGLVGSVRYVEYRTDDARLTMEVMKKANELGAIPINYAKVTGFQYDHNQKLIGIKAKDQLTGRKYEIAGSIIINATGPWSDLVRDIDDKPSDGKSLLRTKGVHIVIDKKKLPLNQALYFDIPDGRMIFVVPRGEKVYVGTTDTVYKAELENPYMTKEDLHYILETLRYIFPSITITEKDIESSWAGLRPLIHEEGKPPSQVSRKDEIWESPSGLLTIAGGKLTGYRKMGSEIVDLIGKKVGDSFSKSSTKTIPISGGDVGGPKRFEDFIRKNSLRLQRWGLTEELSIRLVRFYGSNVKTIIEEMPIYKQAAKTHNLPMELIITILYSIKHEMAATPSDYFLRRTSTLLFNYESYKKNKESVIRYMKHVLVWTKEETAFHTNELEKQVELMTRSFMEGNT